MEREPSFPPSPRSPVSNQHHDTANTNRNSKTANYWSIFSQGTMDQFASPKRGTPTRPHWRKNNRADDGSSIESSSNNDVVNELTSLLLASPLRTNGTRHEGTTTSTQKQHANNRGVVAAASGAALNNHAAFNKSSSPSRRSSLRERLQMSPLGSRSSNGFQQPLLLQSMRHWEVALPPLKKHVVGGKLVETLQGSLYGNDRERNLPVAKRKLTIELFGHDRNATELWGTSRKHRKFSDLERNLGGYGGSSSCGGGISCGSGGEDDSSWELFKGASKDDFSIAKDDDCHSKADSSFVVNDGDTGDRKYELAERDVVVLRIMKSRMVTPYDDEFCLGDNSINGGLKDRKWESQTMSDRTMSWMVGLEAGDRDYCDRDDNASFSSGESFAKKHVRWTELSRTRLSQIELVREDFEANEVDLKMGVDARTVVQTFRFDDVNDYYGATKNRHEGHARTFARLFRLLKQLQKKRAQRLATAHRDLLSEHDSSKQGGANDSFSFHDKIFGQESKIAGNDNSSNGNGDGDDCNHEGEKIKTDETVSILMEIISASNLPPPEDRKSDKGEDFFVPDPEVPSSSDPYVVVRDGKTDVHTTSFIPDTINPVWTLSTGSLFLLQSNLVDFFERSNVLEFTVKSNKAMVGIENQTIGTVMIHKTELLNGTGERKYYQILRPPTSSRSKNTVHNTDDDSAEAPCLYLRYRHASMEDVEFMKTFQEETKRKSDLQPEDGVYASEAFLPPQLHTTPFLHRSTEKLEGEDEKSPRYRVKPTPDPENVPVTEWMTETQIEEVSKDHSTSWTMAGSGSIGKLYIEIMGCDGLTNPARASGYKSDPFVNIVHEDSIVNTDAIHDCLSPRWMPWSQRAFVMNMMHLSSQIFIGVFDYINSNQGIGSPASAEVNHDPLGRAVINLSSLRPRAIHTLTYNLYDSDDDDRECRGTITIRLRLAIDDERRALLSELSRRDHFYVSTVKGSDFRCASYSLANNNQPLSFSLRSLTNYKKELLGYIEQTDHITGALAVILLWRGHFPVTLNLDSVFYVRRQEIALNLPLHSIVAFAWATILAWDLDKIFSFFWFVIGWAFLAELEDQRRHPSPWRRPRSYPELLRTLIFHRSNFGVLGRPPLRRTIHPNERLREIERFESHEAVKAAARQKRLEKSNAEREQHQKRREEEEFTTRQDILNDQNNSSESNRTDDDVTPRDMNETTFSDAMLPSIEAILFPIQKILWEACRLVRVCSSVFLWKDSYLAFWITTLSFSASFLAFWIPWAWLIQWEFRLFVWPLFGPWMKLVDIYYIQREKNHPKGEEIISQSETEILENLYNRMLGQEEWSAVCRENTLKNKDMKRYMFGKCSMRVPIFQEEHFPCEPAISSSSVPYNTNPRPVHVARRIHGQRLKGDMVPYRNYNSNSGRGDGIATT